MTIRRKWLRNLLILLALLISSPIILVNCMSFGPSTKKIQTAFENAGIQPEMQTRQTNHGQVHSVATGPADRPMIVFVHGSPGGWHNFLNYLVDDELVSRARLVALDRPGFGASDRGKAQPSQAIQAAAVAAILRENQNAQKPILVGHSLGGPVIARVAMDYPDLVGRNVMIAPSIDPTLEKTKWIQIPAQWRLINWMIPIDLLTTNREILPLKGELEQMLPMWPQITAPTTVFHGTKDELVPYGNALFAEEKIVSAPVEIIRLEDQNHFIVWSHHVLIRDYLVRCLAEATATP